MNVELGNSRARVLAASVEEHAWLIRFLSFEDESRAFRRDRRTGRAKRVQPPKIRLLDVVDDTFPAGLLPIVRRGAGREGFVVDVVDVRAPRAPLDRGAFVGWLRPYQLEGLRAALRHERGILKMPTGSGKTEIVVALARVLPTPGLFVVHRTGLMSQTSQRYYTRNEEHGVKLPPVGQFGDAVACIGERLTVATFQTVRARLGTAEGAELVRRVTWIVVDECFPAGTVVDGRPIEMLRSGDACRSFDPETGSVVARRIVRVFERPASTLVRIMLATGEQIVSTPGHPFLTTSGWLPAYRLCGSYVLSLNHEQSSVDTMHNLRDDPSANDDSEEPARLLRRVPEDSIGEPPKDGRAAMPGLRCPGRANGPSGAGAGPDGARVLLGDAQGRGGSAPCVYGFDSYRDGQLSCVGGTNALSEPHERPEDPTEGQRDAPCDRAQTAVPWRERLDYVGTTTETARDVAGPGERMDRGARRQDARCERAPIRVEDRHSEPCAEDRDRDRRRLSRGTSGEGAGLAEGRIPSTVRVEGVEVLEPGDDGEFGGLCPGGAVYNLEIEDVPTYAVGRGGLVVHNCHTLPADTFFETVLAFENARIRIGLSGTPLDRGDRRSLMAVGALGPLVYSVPTEELVVAGVLARPTVRFVRVVQNVDRPTWQGVYGEAVVRSAVRNKAIVDIARRAAKPFLVFVKEIKHGRALETSLGRAGLNVKMVWGDSPEPVRAAAQTDLARGDLDGVVASVVWQEGIDVPGLRSVIVAAGGKSVIASLQRAGRGMRRTDEKTEFEIWDINDSNVTMLDKHSRARRRAYEREQFDVRDLELDQLEEYTSRYET